MLVALHSDSDRVHRLGSDRRRLAHLCLDLGKRRLNSNKHPTISSSSNSRHRHSLQVSTLVLLDPVWETACRSRLTWVRQVVQLFDRLLVNNSSTRAVRLVCHRSVQRRLEEAQELPRLAVLPPAAAHAAVHRR